MKTDTPYTPTAQDRATETPFNETLMDVLRLLDTLPRHEREELLHHVKCSLAEFNRIYAQAYFTDDDDQAACFRRDARERSRDRGRLRLRGRRCRFPPTLCLDVHGVSTTPCRRILLVADRSAQAVRRSCARGRLRRSAGTGRQAANGPLTMTKPVDMSRINPDALLLHARAAADYLGRADRGTGAPAAAARSNHQRPQALADVDE